MVECKEIHNIKDPDFKEAIRVYEEGFREQKEIYMDPIIFKWMLSNKRKDRIPHIVVLKSGRVIGMASFTSTPLGAIGWYITIIKEERNKGYSSFLLEKIKDIILEDALSKNWHDENYLFAEFEQEKAEIWSSKGFTILPIRYYQPPLIGKNEWIPLLLGAMPVRANKITGTEVLKFISYIYFKIYHVSKYKDNDYFKNIRDDCEFLSMRL
jgi:hypothetical protein